MGNTYETTLKPLFMLQKKAVRISTFSKLGSFSSPLFKSLGIIKFFDIALFQIAIFMYKFHNNVLPAAFHSFFTKITSVHNYHTRFAAKHNITYFYLHVKLDSSLGLKTSQEAFGNAKDTI